MRFALLVLMLLPGLLSAAEIETGDPALDAAFAQIMDNDFDVKAQGVDALVASGHPKAVELLNGLQDGSLRRYTRTDRLVWAIDGDAGYAIRDVFSGEDLGVESSRKVRKLPINNTVRGRIDAALASLDLNSPDPARRLAAVGAMLAKPDPAAIPQLRTLLASETDPAVRALTEIALAVSRLGNSDADERLAAVDALAGRLEPTVRNALQATADHDADPAVREAAQHQLNLIQQQVDHYALLETLFFGLSAGSVLVLAAIGLAITFGVMGVINMAHGELIMLGAYTTYLIQQAMPSLPGVSLLLAIPAAFVVSGLAGIGIERGVIRFLYGRPLETLLATFGISLVLQQLVRTLISPQNVPVENPEFMSGLWQINPVLSLTYNRLYIFVFSLIVFAALFMVLKKTRLGLEVRAVAQNRAMARAMGVRSARVDALTFGLGSGIAGVAGVALSQLTNVGPNLGQSYIVDSFMVVVFGGVGNLWGTLVAGLSLGVANKILEPWSGAVLAKILVLVFIILFIQKRSRGLFPQKGRAAEG
ncbi:MAG: urea ABC transporter permease subunit UrtB [Gammaproteobacteria bacterium]|nr:urea ABC transporter permease subunit UrtB [Gammaproteobacteria bacterium]